MENEVDQSPIPPSLAARRGTHIDSFYDRIKKIVKHVFSHYITRDIDITRDEFLTICFLFSAEVVLIVYMVNSIWLGNRPPALGVPWDVIYLLGSVVLILAGAVSGIFIDRQKSRIRWTFAILVISSSCFLFLNRFIANDALYVIGVIISCFSALFLFLATITILVEKTSILDRARVTAMTLIFVSVVTAIVLAFVGLGFIDYSFILFFLFLGVAALLARRVKWYTEKEDIHVELTREMLRLGVFQYTILFFGLSFLIGVSVNAVQVNYGFMIGFMFPWAVGSAIIMDNIGRKGTIIVTVLLMAMYIIFSGYTTLYSVDILSG
ncbi:MAG TPA: hypothetical protein VKK79_23475, partial [Candidatus Lokiarchaeia archaeon]|nr:hypothetical protein [Candidatus Lokiarchaeia archaeon]